jgi:hypothetical protein
MSSKLNLKENLEENFVAFLDVMGFSNLVNGGRIDSLEAYFEKITQVLDDLIHDKTKIKSFLISDSIILLAPQGLDGFKQLITAIRRIQNALLAKKVLLRGAVSYGQVYYNKERNIIVGKGFIKAYLLEQEAIYPRVIIDPYIIKLISDDKSAFLKQINNTLEYSFESRLIYAKSDFSKISEDCIFVDYANKTILRDSINDNLKKVYESIVENLYSDQKLFSKYIWLRDYFLEILLVTSNEVQKTSLDNSRYQNQLKHWITKFERL